MAEDDPDSNVNDDWGSAEEWNSNKERPNFPVFTNPLDMERFFNHQMDDILKSFGFFGFSGGNEENNTKSSEQIPGNFQSGGQSYGKDDQGSRDFMLKEDQEKNQKLKTPGYVEPDAEIDVLAPDINKRGKKSRKIDDDLDTNGINYADLNKLYKPSQRSPTSEPHPPFFENRSSGTGSLFGHLFGDFFPNSDQFTQPQVIQIVKT